MAVTFTYLCPLLNAFHTKYVWTWFDFSITTLVSNKIQTNKAINIVHIAQVRKLILRTNLWSQLSTQMSSSWRFRALFSGTAKKQQNSSKKFSFAREILTDFLFVWIGCLMICTQSLAIYVFGGERGIGWDARGVSWEGTKEKYRSNIVAREESPLSRDINKALNEGKLARHSSRGSKGHPGTHLSLQCREGRNSSNNAVLYWSGLSYISIKLVS